MVPCQELQPGFDWAMGKVCSMALRGGSKPEDKLEGGVERWERLLEATPWKIIFMTGQPNEGFQFEYKKVSAISSFG